MRALIDPAAFLVPEFEIRKAVSRQRCNEAQSTLEKALWEGTTETLLSLNGSRCTLIAVKQFTLRDHSAIE